VLVADTIACVAALALITDAMAEERAEARVVDVA